MREGRQRVKQLDGVAPKFKKIKNRIENKFSKLILVGGFLWGIKTKSQMTEFVQNLCDK